MPDRAGTRSRKTSVPMSKTAQPRMKLSSRGALLHRQLYALLKEQILTGRYRAGDLLPTQEALCRQFSIRAHGAAVDRGRRPRSLAALRLRRGFRRRRFGHCHVGRVHPQTPAASLHGAVAFPMT